MYALGVDIGGVIIERQEGRSDTFFSPEYLETPAVEDAFAGLEHLNDFFAGRIYIVSKAGNTSSRKSREWLDHHDFWRLTGIRPDNLYFCRERADKAPIAAELGVTTFIDDRLDVLGYMPEVQRRILFKADPTVVARNRDVLSSVEQVGSWVEACELLTGTSCHV